MVSPTKKEKNLLSFGSKNKECKTTGNSPKQDLNKKQQNEVEKENVSLIAKQKRTIKDLERENYILESRFKDKEQEYQDLLEEKLIREKNQQQNKELEEKGQNIKKDYENLSNEFTD